jgi:hypothetical protein
MDEVVAQGPIRHWLGAADYFQECFAPRLGFQERESALTPSLRFLLEPV